MPTYSTFPSNKGAGCAFLFLLPFGGAGVAMMALALWTVWDWQQMQSWEATPATLLSLDLQHNDKSTRIRGEYQYTFDGQQYQSTRIAIDEMADNIGDYQQRHYRELMKARQAGRTVTAYVNPSDPSRAVLLRDLRMEMVAFKAALGGIFGVIGVGGILMVWFNSRKIKQQALIASRAPAEPWLWRSDWADGRVVVSGFWQFFAMLVLAVIMNLICWVTIYAVLQDNRQPSTVAWIVLSLFAIGSIAQVGYTVICFFRWRRFPEATFRLAHVPGVIGDKLAGVLLLPGVVRPAKGFRMQLRCTRRVRRGKNTTHITLWEQEQTIDQTLDDNDFEETAVPVVFELPPDVEPSDPYSRNPVRWVVKVTANLPGPNANFEFEVPVFEVAE